MKRKSSSIKMAAKKTQGKGVLDDQTSSQVNLRVAVSQMNFVVGDFEYNANRIENCLKDATKFGADLILFPELTLTGYPPEDLLLKDDFIAKNKKLLRHVALGVRGVVAVVGYVEKVKRNLYNSAALLYKGKVIGNYRKMILQKSGSGNKTVASLDSRGSASPYVTDIFNDPYVLVELSSDAKEINPGFSGLENFGSKTVEEAQVAKLGSALNTESKSSKNFLQKNKSGANQVLWQKMVRKVSAKKSGKKKAGKKTSKKSLVGGNSDTNKNQRNRSSNLTPVSGARPFERGSIPLQQRSFR